MYWSFDSQGHSTEVHSVCWDVNGDYLASVSQETVRVWSLTTGDCIHELSSSGNKFHSCVFHPSYSTLLVIGGYQVIFALWCDRLVLEFLVAFGCHMEIKKFPCVLYDALERNPVSFHLIKRDEHCHIYSIIPTLSDCLNFNYHIFCINSFWKKVSQFCFKKQSILGMHNSHCWETVEIKIARELLLILPLTCVIDC